MLARHDAMTTLTTSAGKWKCEKDSLIQDILSILALGLGGFCNVGDSESCRDAD